ncbi:MAG: ferritin family protein [Bacillota bacterium]
MDYNRPYMDYNQPYMMPGMGYGYGMPMSYKSLTEALELVKDAVRGEREDELFYDYLISKAPTREEKEIIAGIRDDERKHNKMFRKIYKDFTGQEIMTPKDVDFKKPKSYIDGIKRAFFGELAAMERYRDIRAGLPGRYYRDMVFEILTDEMEHADKYNYILILNVKDHSKHRHGASEENDNTTTEEE